MPTAEDKFKAWVGRELRHLRETYMDANGIKSQELFAERAGVPWSTIANIEDAIHCPRIDTLNLLVTTCDSNLAEFFAGLVNRMELAAIERKAKDETEWMATLAAGLSNPKTRRVVQGTAETVADFLSLLKSQ